MYNEKRAVSSLNIDEIFTLKTLSKNNDLILQKSGKGNSIVVINKNDYLGILKNSLAAFFKDLFFEVNFRIEVAIF